jgi:predicted CoA-binding protein
MEGGKTLVLGASVNEERYANRAIRSLRKHGYPVYAIGLREGLVGDTNIQTGRPDLADVDTVTLYLSKKNQQQYHDFILKLKPRRIIYNPGAENNELKALASDAGIENLEACTLVLLATNQY